MPAAVLTIDQGNSTTDVCRFEDGSSVDRRRIRRGADEAAELQRWLAANRPAACVGAAVRYQGEELLRRCAAEAGCELWLAGGDLPCPMPVAYRNQETLGVDRWVGAYAAWLRTGGACLTIDCGTAVTCNLVSAAGVFLGGAIGSGFTTLVRGLAAAAPRLAIPVEGPPRVVPADNTEDALRLGHWHGWCGLVDRLAAELLESLAPSVAAVIATGGEAPVFLAGSRLRPNPIHVPDLIHRGLLALWQRRAQPK